MEEKDIHIGDVLYVRDWEDLLQDGYLNTDGGIEFTGSSNTRTVTFDAWKRCLCGKKFTVKSVHERDFGALYGSIEHGDRGMYAIWLTPNDSAFETATDAEIRLLLS